MEVKRKMLKEMGHRSGAENPERNPRTIAIIEMVFSDKNILAATA